MLWLFAKFEIPVPAVFRAADENAKTRAMVISAACGMREKPIDGWYYCAEEVGKYRSRSPSRSVIFHHYRIARFHPRSPLEAMTQNFVYRLADVSALAQLL